MTDISYVAAKGSGPEWPSWLEELYTVADNLDAPGFAAIVGAKGSMRFGNAPTVNGLEEVESTVGGLFSAITSMSHKPIRVWEDGRDIIFEAVVTYGRSDGTPVDIPAVTAYTRDADGNLHGRIYCDLAPVFETA